MIPKGNPFVVICFAFEPRVSVALHVLRAGPRQHRSYIHIYIHVHVYVCTHVCVCVCVCVYTYTHIHIHIQLHFEGMGDTRSNLNPETLGAFQLCK